ncbi:hypothetical protein QTP86_005426 [Hemibagrus guttatus]|nr:hypothetical protein QTP86_005426 [Hemibagrus guttatus]
MAVVVNPGLDRSDLEKAYDRVPREELWYCMRKSGVAEKYVRVVQDMYERSRTVVRCAVGQTEEFNVEVGLHQGSALSPFLFAMVMDQLSEEVRQESPWTMMIADDIVICSESREQVEENLERWRFALERRGMKVSGIQSNGEYEKEVKKRVQAETVSLRKRQESELEVAELKMLREDRLRWFGHVQRRESEYTGRRMLDMELPGRRQRGRPKRSIVTPYIITQTPHIITQTPYIITQTPYIITQKPHIITQTPYIITQKPHIITQTPYNITQTPYIITQTPYIITQKPHIITQKPHNITQTPYNITQTPYIITQKPHIITQKPHNITQTPYNITQTPYNITQTPYIITQKPHIITQTPYIITQTPHIITQTPYIITQKPHIITDTLQHHTDTSHYHTDTSHHHTDNSNQISCEITYKAAHLHPSLLPSLPPSIPLSITPFITLSITTPL